MIPLASRVIRRSILATTRTIVPRSATLVSVNSSFQAQANPLFEDENTLPIPHLLPSLESSTVWERGGKGGWREWEWISGVVGGERVGR